MYIDLTGVKERMTERQIFINRLQKMDKNGVEKEIEGEIKDNI
ncbi:hypothetical protein Halha_0728 [Halobacteroides halobius DSM 5150]|uniref:Uncharacterized protein n=1 Tax=Halobacteroides halobius (strain ATCC 35273 / DSM 5150 / MD-1) TaxID=748449 RepID=L0K6P7_HALHC|nr:hypothetical protein [Halobacteroides halobius]AGB40701.1 hypothetical protein Halha_0728 [Halobacteroides halobius DSM 5150]